MDYAESFLSILFAFGGFNQANYVMGEVNNPRRRHKWPAFSSVTIVSLLYILVDIAYFIVAPAGDYRPSPAT
jgi:amino acid transporter